MLFTKNKLALLKVSMASLRKPFRIFLLKIVWCTLRHLKIGWVVPALLHHMEWYRFYCFTGITASLTHIHTSPHPASCFTTHPAFSQILQHAIYNSCIVLKTSEPKKRDQNRAKKQNKTKTYLLEFYCFWRPLFISVTHFTSVIIPQSRFLFESQF